MATAEHRSLLLGQYMPYQMVNLAKREESIPFIF